VTAAPATRRAKPPRPAVVHSTPTRTLLRDPLLRAWGAFIVLFPMYILPSGLPQPADAVLLVLMPFVLQRWSGRLGKPQRRAVFALLAFAAYTTISAVVWSLWLGTISINLRIGFLLSPVFYIYNALVFVMGLALYQLRGPRFIEITVRAAVVSVLIQVPLSFVFGHHSLLRSTGMFNNPNQFGYYAVLSASIIVLGQRRAGLTALHSAVGVVACSYLALISASKAGLAATALILIVSLITRIRTVIFASVIAAVALLAIDPQGDTVNRTLERINTDKSYDFAEERGYDRIAQHPEHWVLGAGEGAYYRYADTGKIGEHELHSSAGTIFFCYGIVGSAVFLWFFFQLVRIAKLRQMIMLGPVVAYGLSHQGMRVTLLWIFLALFVSLADSTLLARGPPRSVKRAPRA
jgi:hypothetical protein